MNIRNLLIVNAIVLGISGLCAIVLPDTVLSIYGVESSPSASLMAQYAGLGSIAIGLIAWFNRGIKESTAKKTLTPAFLIVHSGGAIISVCGTISGVMKIGWAAVGLYLLFALAYAYFQFVKKE
jgi:hypothetical protein